MDENSLTLEEALGVLELTLLLKNLRSFVIDNHYTLASFRKEFIFIDKDEETASFWYWLRGLERHPTTPSEVMKYMPIIKKILFILDVIYGITLYDILRYDKEELIIHDSKLTTFVNCYIPLIIVIAIGLLVDFRITILIFIIGFFCDDDD